MDIDRCIQLSTSAVQSPVVPSSYGLLSRVSWHFNREVLCKGKALHTHVLRSQPLRTHRFLPMMASPELHVTGPINHPGIPSSKCKLLSTMQYITAHLLQRQSRKGRQDKRRLVDARVVVSVPLVLLLLRYLPQRLGHVAGGILAAHHKANLAGRVGGDGGVCVLGHREHLAARLLQLGDDFKVQPLVLGCENTHSQRSTIHHSRRVAGI